MKKITLEQIDEILKNKNVKFIKIVKNDPPSEYGYAYTEIFFFKENDFLIEEQTNYIQIDEPTTYTTIMKKEKNKSFKIIETRINGSLYYDPEEKENDKEIPSSLEIKYETIQIEKIK